jgi:hypothetical protein
MKPQRSRSRSKNNRNRPNSNNASGGNVMNRVFDSSGPEGKVRGTPQQIIDKYNQLARDAQLSNDRVATETFQQHAEHYMRMLSEATREMEERREEQERQNRERQIERDREREERVARQEALQPKPVEQTEEPVDPASVPQPDVIETSAESGLVETPETQPKPKPRQRRKPLPKPVEQTADPALAAEVTVPTSETPDAAE